MKGSRGHDSGHEHCKGLRCVTDGEGLPCSCDCDDCIYCDAFADGAASVAMGETIEPPKACAHQELVGDADGIACEACDLAHSAAALAFVGYSHAPTLVANAFELRQRADKAESRASELADELGLMHRELEEADRKTGETARRLVKALRDLEDARRARGLPTGPTSNPHTHLKRQG